MSIFNGMPSMRKQMKWAHQERMAEAMSPNSSPMNINPLIMPSGQGSYMKSFEYGGTNFPQFPEGIINPNRQDMNRYSDSFMRAQQAMNRGILPAMQSGGSIVDYLKAEGDDSSREARRKMAMEAGFKGDFSAADNTALLNYLKNKKKGQNVGASAMAATASMGVAETTQNGSRRVDDSGNTYVYDSQSKNWLPDREWMAKNQVSTTSNMSGSALPMTRQTIQDVDPMGNPISVDTMQPRVAEMVRPQASVATSPIAKRTRPKIVAPTQAAPAAVVTPTISNPNTAASQPVIGSYFAQGNNGFQSSPAPLNKKESDLLDNINKYQSSLKNPELAKNNYTAREINNMIREGKVSEAEGERLYTLQYFKNKLVKNMEQKEQDAKPRTYPKAFTKQIPYSQVPYPQR